MTDKNNKKGNTDLTYKAYMGIRHMFFFKEILLIVTCLNVSK